MRKLTVPLGAAAAVVMFALAVTSITPRAAGSYADDRSEIYNENRDEWAYQGGKNPAW